jgi:hypothetical protein
MIPRLEPPSQDDSRSGQMSVSLTSRRQAYDERIEQTKNGLLGSGESHRQDRYRGDREGDREDKVEQGSKPVDR